MVSVKKIFSCTFHSKPMADNDAPKGGGGAVWNPGPPLAGFIKKTLLHTKYESSGPCGFGEEYFIYVFPLYV